MIESASNEPGGIKTKFLNGQRCPNKDRGMEKNSKDLKDLSF
jgi:hypothetical protein